MFYACNVTSWPILLMTNNTIFFNFPVTLFALFILLLLFSYLSWFYYTSFEPKGLWKQPLYLTNRYNLHYCIYPTSSNPVCRATLAMLLLYFYFWLFSFSSFYFWQIKKFIVCSTVAFRQKMLSSIDILSLLRDSLDSLI